MGEYYLYLEDGGKLDKLLEQIGENLNLPRIYTKPDGSTAIHINRDIWRFENYRYQKDNLHGHLMTEKWVCFIVHLLILLFLGHPRLQLAGAWEPEMFDGWLRSACHRPATCIRRYSAKDKAVENRFLHHANSRHARFIISER